MQDCLHSRVSSFRGNSLRRQQGPALSRCLGGQQDRCRQVQPCRASMGIGFTEGLVLPGREHVEPPKLFCPDKKDYGLSIRQMAALGLTDTDVSRELEENEMAISAKAAYASQPVTTTAGHRTATTMRSAGGGGGRRRGKSPPDLPSMLLDSRICFIGMPLVPAVTELVVSELLWLGYNYPEKPVYIYLNCIGSQDARGQSLGFEQEAYAIMDTIAYIKPEIYTLTIGAAYGNAAMILASGKKGNRWSLPNARIMTCPPRMNRSFGSTSDIMIKANELEYNTQMYVDFMSKYTGHSKEKMRKDIGRKRYFTPLQAIDYGIIDKIVQPMDQAIEINKDYGAVMARQQAQQRSVQREPAGASADAGY